MKYTFSVLAFALIFFTACKKSSTTSSPIISWKFRNTTYSNNNIQRMGGGFSIEDSSTGVMQRLSFIFNPTIPTSNTSMRLGTALIVGVTSSNNSVIYLSQASSTTIAIIGVNNGKLSISIPQTWLYNSNTFDPATGNFIADSALFSCNIQEP